MFHQPPQHRKARLPLEKPSEESGIKNPKLSLKPKRGFHILTRDLAPKTTVQPVKKVGPLFVKYTRLGVQSPVIEGLGEFQLHAEPPHELRGKLPIAPSGGMARIQVL